MLFVKQAIESEKSSVRKITPTYMYNKAPTAWNMVLFSLISIAFLVSDWVVLYSSFGDFVLAFTVVLFAALGQVKLSRKLIGYGSIPVLFLVLNYVLNVNFNDYWFDTTRAYLSAAKIAIYLSTLLLTYSLIKRKRLMKQFLKISNAFAILSIIIGIAITILIYMNRETVYTFLWTFTRTDQTSYLFNENPNIVRTRSLFSEPAHLGFYLNTVIFANVFSEEKNNYWVLSILAAGVLLTLSYSMIIILIVTSMAYLASLLIKGDFKWHWWYFTPLIPLVVLSVYFWEYIDVAILQRTLDIFAGTDGSAYNRIIESWIYVPEERIIFGNGIAHSPPITNIFAYVLTDFGLVGFIPYVIFTLYIFYIKPSLFVLFIMMNAAKGGYLNPSIWLFLLFMFVCMFRKSTGRVNRFSRSGHRPVYKSKRNKLK